MGRIVVGADGSACSTAATRWAIDEARRRTDTSVDVVSAWEFPPPADFYAMPSVDELEKEANRQLERTVFDVDTTGVEVHAYTARGPASEVLIEQAADTDLLVVGSRGHGAFVSMLIGSVALRVVTHPPCPVVVVPPPQ